MAVLRGESFICSLVYMDVTLSSADVLMYLKITVAVVVLIVLYHFLFIAVDLRKIMRRISTITEEVENVIMKPINAADYILDGIINYFEQQGGGGKKKAKKKSSRKKK